MEILKVLGSVFLEIGKYLIKQLGRYFLILGGIMLFMLALRGCVFGA